MRNSCNQRYRCGFSKRFTSVLEDVGVDVTKLFEISALPGRLTLADSKSEYPLTQWHRLLHVAVKISGDPGLALRLGHSIDMASHGTYGFAIFSNADIRAATALSLRYAKVVEGDSNWTVIEHVQCGYVSN
jgi:hypothetical protein